MLGNRTPRAAARSARCRRWNLNHRALNMPIFSASLFRMDTAARSDLDFPHFCGEASRRCLSFGRAEGISVVSVRHRDMDKSQAAQARGGGIDALLLIAAGDPF